MSVQVGGFNIGPLNDLDTGTFTKLISSVLSSSAQSRISTLVQDPSAADILFSLKDTLEALKQKSKKVEDLEAWVSGLALDDDKKEELTRIAEEYRTEILGKNRSELEKELPILRAMNWRFEVEIATRETKKCFHPSYLTNFVFDQPVIGVDGKISTQEITLCTSADAGVIRKLGDEMKQASSFPRSITYRKLNRNLNKQ